MRRDPEDIIGLYYLALCEYYDGNQNEAEEIVIKLLKKSDQFAPAYHLLGLISEKKGDKDAAYNAFQAAMEGGWKPAGVKLDQYRFAGKQARGKLPRGKLPTFFISIIDPDKCIGCGECIDVCPAGILAIQGEKAVVVNAEECLGCECCVDICEQGAVTVEET